MKKNFLSFFLFLFFVCSTYSVNDYKSIEEVKTLNYELFEEIGFDENKINYVSRVIYSTYKKANYMASNGVSPEKALTLDEEAEEMLLRVLTQAELKSFNSIKHKLK